MNTQSVRYSDKSDIQLYNLEPIIIKTLQGTGIVNINSIPPGADVYLNGDLYGKAPITITDVEPGEHTYMLKLLGYTDYVSQVDVKVGELCCQTVDLQYAGSAGTCVTAPSIVPVPVPTVQLSGIALATIGIIIGSLIYKKS